MNVRKIKVTVKFNGEVKELSGKLTDGYMNLGEGYFLVGCRVFKRKGNVICGEEIEYDELKIEKV